MTNSTRPAFLERIDEALKDRNQLADSMEAFASEINPQKQSGELRDLLSVLRSSSQAEQLVQEGFSAAWLPLILRSRLGNDGINLDQIVGEVTFAEEARKSRWRSLAYPLFLFAIALLVFILLAVSVLPTFQKMFSEFALKLPFATQILLRFGNWIVGSPGYFCLSLAGVGLAGLGVRRLMTVAYPYLEASSSVGRLFSGSTESVKAMGRFTSTLAELLFIGAPLDRAISIAGRASQNLRFKNAAKQMATDIGTSGKFRSDSAVAHNFPALVRHALVAGPNATPSVPLLRQVATTYLDRVRHRFDWAEGLFAPLAIVGVGLIVGFIVISLFLPLISLITSLSG